MRGRVSLAINGSFWIGAALGAVLSLVLLDERVLGPEHGWRAGFLLGARAGAGDPAGAPPRAREPALAAGAWPRRGGRALLDAIEAERARRAPGLRHDAAHAAVHDSTARAAQLGEVVHVLRRRYARRSAVVLALMMSQAFFYNAIFFTYALVLTRFYGVADDAGRAVPPAVRGWATCWGRCCWGRCSTASAGG